MNNTIETIHNEKIDTLNDLIEITRDSAKFYSDAAGEVSNPQLKSLFSDMAQSKNGLVGAMSKQVRSEGAKPAESGTVRGALHKLYTDVRTRFGDTNYGYVRELEETEDRMLKAFDNVAGDSDTPAEVRTLVNGYLPTIRQHHDMMRDRKWAMKANNA